METTPRSELHFWPIEESGGLVRIDRHNLPDLDELMLDVLMDRDVRERLSEQWEDQIYPGGEHDRPTAIPYCDRWYRGEAEVGYFRTNPCTCGEEHQFDLGTVQTDEEDQPIGKSGRGAFLGVWFR
ncbi:hypothetical protein HR12_39510 [Microbacterium sp. SUBG005]|nr:hypothetical protein HR12_39510 [Microbacterium sp. SUBG005]